MDASTRCSTLGVGALPVVAAFLDDLEIGRIVDDVVPWEGDVPLGTIVEVLIVNRLMKPGQTKVSGTNGTVGPNLRYSRVLRMSCFNLVRDFRISL